MRVRGVGVVGAGAVKVEVLSRFVPTEILRAGGICRGAESLVSWRVFGESTFELLPHVYFRSLCYSKLQLGF